MVLDCLETFHKKIKERSLTLVCAESITAGLLASEIASIPGASSILKGSIVTYNRDMKEVLLKVDPLVIDKYTAESMQTTIAMVEGLASVYKDADIYVAVTGVASPSTYEYIVDKSVGQIYVAIIYSGKLYERDTVIKSVNRNEIRSGAVEYILTCVMEIL